MKSDGWFYGTLSGAVIARKHFKDKGVSIKVEELMELSSKKNYLDMTKLKYYCKFIGFYY